MTTASTRALISVLSFALLGCGPESDQVVFEIQAQSFANSEWSAPVNLAGLLNTGFNEFRPDLSRDGRTLLFDSDRPGGSGGTDIWITTRTPSGN